MPGTGAQRPGQLFAGNDLLWRAHRAATAGDMALALQLRSALPAGLAHTGHLLDANAAVVQGDPARWRIGLNLYLARWRVAPVLLRKGRAPLLDRLHCAGLPPVPDGPKISVILCAHNAAGTIAAATRSILAQRWRNLELIAVDDASRDGTAGILHDLARADPRLRVIANPVNVGPYVGRNIALGLATGDWITVQDADDWSHPERLSRHLRSVLKSASPPPVSAVGMLRMTPEGRFSQIRVVGGESLDGVLQHAPMSPLFAADFLKGKLGSWDCAHFGADSELMARAEALTGHPAPRLEQFSLIALDHPGSLTGNPLTGVHPDFGLSPARRAYKRAWRRWQARALTPDTAFLAFPPGPDRFARPAAAQVERGSIDQAIRSIDSL